MLLYVLATLLGSFLVFLVQPLIGKFILPWYGGTPAVWTVCLLFFQVMLVAGYGYAFLLAQYCRPRLQIVIHAVVLSLSLLSLPIIPSDSWRGSATAHPVSAILGLLLVTVGAPYGVLAASAPLIQQWFHQAYPGRSPYRLYAVSNVASLSALLAYPFAWEPWLELRTQTQWWSWLYVGYAVTLFGSAAALWMATTTQQRSSEQPQPGTPSSSEALTATPRVTDRWFWILLSALGTAMLMATTNQLTQDVVPIPFLWILPLVLYLLSFIITFDRPQWYVRPVWVFAFIGSLVLAAWLVTNHRHSNFVWQIAIYSLNMFLACMCCHGELVCRRPRPELLTRFYLALALGGALGGTLVTLVAPAVLREVREYWFANILICLALLATGRQSQLEGWISRWGAWRTLAVGTLAAVSLLAVLSNITLHRGRGAVRTVAAARNFYGALAIREGVKSDAPGARRWLSHGTTEHGFQFQDPEHAQRPTSYYDPRSGVGLAIEQHPRRRNGEPLRIGVIGLGTGTLAAYADAQDQLVFYEINPIVIDLAQRYFTYTSAAQERGARFEVRLGDARRLLEQEKQAGDPQSFDVLVVDAFSSDAIPVHLLTRECVELYRYHLAPQGILAVHISNRYINLRPVVAQHAAAFGDTGVLVSLPQSAPPDPFQRTTASDWVLLTADAPLRQHLLSQQHAGPLAPASQRSVPQWTDNYSSLFPLLR